MAPSPSVRLGFWTDYDVSPSIPGLANLITTTEKWGTIWKIFVGVVFGLCWSSAKAIIARSWAWARYLHHRRRSQQAAEPEPERELLLGPDDSTYRGSVAANYSGESGISQAVVLYQATDTNPTAEASETGSINDLEAPPEPHAHNIDNVLIDENTKPKFKSWLPQIEWPDIFLAMLLAITAVLYAVAGGAVGEVHTSTSGLSGSESCGSWDLRGNADQRIRDNDDLYQARKETRAAQYGRNCYGEQSTASPNLCDFFQSTQIDYSVETIDCPFECKIPDRCICANGIYGSAVRLDTHPFSANKIGLNGANLPLIKRTSIFVPLNINSGFVRVIGSSGDDLEIEYYLGSVNASGQFRNYTFNMYGLPFDWDIPAYSVSAYESTPSGKEYDAWQPIKELDRPRNTYMTAIFISPCRIIYTGRCEDPIFLATDELDEDGWPSPRFYNQDPRARVLIAIDQMEVCPHDPETCYPPDEEYPEYGVEYEFVRAAMRRTSTFRSIEYRLGSALVAAESISDFESRQLDKEQWIIESKALFNTSLARLQFNALDIAVGDRPVGDAAAGHEGAYHDTTPSWARGKLCGKYKFHVSNQYTNIHIGESVGILLVPFFLFVLSHETKSRFEASMRPWLQGYWMVFDSIIRWLIVSIQALWERLKELC